MHNPIRLSLGFELSDTVFSINANHIPVLCYKFDNMKKKTLYCALFIASLGATAVLTMKSRDAWGVGYQLDNTLASCSSSSSTSGSTGGGSSGGSDSMPRSVIALLK